MLKRFKFSKKKKYKYFSQAFDKIQFLIKKILYLRYFVSQ
jgi:mannosyltransferase OCH1-like enzyme